MEGQNTITVTECLGPNLKKLFLLMDKQFTIGTIAQIAIQVVRKSPIFLISLPFSSSWTLWNLFTVMIMCAAILCQKRSLSVYTRNAWHYTLRIINKRRRLKAQRGPIMNKTGSIKQFSINSQVSIFILAYVKKNFGFLMTKIWFSAFKKRWFGILSLYLDLFL